MADVAKLADSTGELRGMEFPAKTYANSTFKTIINTQSGPRGAIAPLVISASRATDIPAFHSKWFMNRVKAGYCIWKNPFNATNEQYVSFEKCKVFVFWSKNPKPLIPWLSELDDRGYQYYFQFTLNDYVKEKLEPGVPDLEKRIETFQKLSERIGKHRVIWRFDPIMIGNIITVENMLERIQRLAKHIAPYTEKIVFSFLDMHRKTEKNLKAIDPRLRAPAPDEERRLARELVKINNALSPPLTMATCGEKSNFADLGISHNKCVDPALLLKLCPHDPEIISIYSISSRQGNLISQPQPDESLKDKGQRELCGCAPGKDIGAYDTCMHLCAYCFANYSKEKVIKKMNELDPAREWL